MLAIRCLVLLPANYIFTKLQRVDLPAVTVSVRIHLTPARVSTPNSINQLFLGFTHGEYLKKYCQTRVGCGDKRTLSPPYH